MNPSPNDAASESADDPSTVQDTEAGTVKPQPAMTQAEAVAAEASSMLAPGSDGARIVPRVVSLIMLVAIVLLVTAMFFRVMLQFVAPLFLAGVLVVIFEPLHKWVLRRCTPKPQWAALITTALVAAMVIIPITGLGIMAAFEMPAVVDPLIKLTNGDSQEADELSEVVSRVNDRSEGYIDWYEQTFQVDFEAQLRGFATQAGEVVVSSGVHTVLWAFGFFFGLGIMAFAMYYFLADGPAMVEGLMQLSPLDDDYERELLEKFAEVSRAVVVATLLSAAAQGLMAGIGYWFVLDSGPIFLLTVVTMLMAIVPFVGATIIWVPVVLWVYLYEGQAGQAIGLFLWCAIAVSNIDNIIKPYVLHGQSNLHPLLALLSVLGGVTVLGPVGILVGPMLVAFLQALLNMLRKELDQLKGESPPLAKPPSPAG